MGQIELTQSWHRQEEVARIVEQGFEAKLDIEVAGRVIDGVDFDRPDAGLVGQKLDTSQGIEQEKGAQATALAPRSTASLPSKTTGMSIRGNPLA